jgi:hypothetical protein
MHFLTRSLPLFGLDLVWNGKQVLSMLRSNGCRQMVEMYEARDLVEATEIMRDMEESYHNCCCGME